MEIFNLYILYSQIIVCNVNLEVPFNGWNDQKVKQGFSWRNESVSFKTLLEDGYSEIKFEIFKTSFEAKNISNNSERIISVPFANINDSIEIATITESKIIEMPKGDYNLIFETGFNYDQTMWVNFKFFPGKTDKFQIIKADKDLSAHDDFDITYTAA